MTDKRRVVVFRNGMNNNFAFGGINASLLFSLV